MANDVSTSRSASQHILYALLATVPLTVLFVLSHFVFAFVVWPFEKLSADLPGYLFVILHLILVGVLTAIAVRKKLPFYYLISIIVALLLSFGFGPMD